MSLRFARAVLVIGQLLAIACLTRALGVAAYAGATPLWEPRSARGVRRKPHEGLRILGGSVDSLKSLTRIR